MDTLFGTVKKIKGIMKVHGVAVPAPGVVATRVTSCYKECCLSLEGKWLLQCEGWTRTTLFECQSESDAEDDMPLSMFQTLRPEQSDDESDDEDDGNDEDDEYNFDSESHSDDSDDSDDSEDDVPLSRLQRRQSDSDSDDDLPLSTLKIVHFK